MHESRMGYRPVAGGVAAPAAAPPASGATAAAGATAPPAHARLRVHTERVVRSSNR